jgi:hypothetical protein
VWLLPRARPCCCAWQPPGMAFILCEAAAGQAPSSCLRQRVTSAQRLKDKKWILSPFSILHHGCDKGFRGYVGWMRCEGMHILVLKISLSVGCSGCIVSRGMCL